MSGAPLVPDRPELAELGWVSSLHGWALFWSQCEGWPVFPVPPGSKRTYAGSHGASEATTDPGQIREWWERSPRSNIGGVCAGRIVVDDDTSYRTEHTPPAGGLCPPTREFGCRGRHLVYRDPGATSCKGKLQPGVEVKAGPGLYVLLPPSAHPSGKLYEVRSWRPEATAPAQLVEAVRRSPVTGETYPEPPAAEPVRYLTPRERRAIEGPHNGDRSAHTFYVACQAIRSGRTPGQVVSVLERDPVTLERWAERAGLRERELGPLLARAQAEAGQ